MATESDHITRALYRPDDPDAERLDDYEHRLAQIECTIAALVASKEALERRYSELFARLTALEGKKEMIR